MFKIEPRRIKASGTVMSVSLARLSELWVLVRTEQGASCIVNMDLAGNVLGRIELPKPGNYPFFVPRRQMRIAKNGQVWIGERSTLRQVGLDGRTQEVIEVPVEPIEELGAFLIVPNGFVVAVHRLRSAEPRGRVLRLDSRGIVMWTTTIPAELVAYSGVVEMSANSEWQQHPKRP